VPRGRHLEINKCPADDIQTKLRFTKSVGYPLLHVEKAQREDIVNLAHIERALCQGCSKGSRVRANACVKSPTRKPVPTTHE
jgi:hypothetical protein